MIDKVYVMFPPQTASADSESSEDDGTVEGEAEAELVGLRLRVRDYWGRFEVEEIVRVLADSVDLTAHTPLVALPAELRACAGRVRDGEKERLREREAD